MKERRPAMLAADDPRRFTIKSGPTRAIVIKSTDGGVDKYFIEGTASSSVRDRHGDTLTDAAQLMMLDQTKDLTMWLNHDYEVPESILGTCGESSLAQEVDPKFGPCIDLNIRCEVYADNPRAMQSWNAIDKGVKLAYSIGGYFLDVEFDESAEDEYWWPLIVNGIDLLEISLVGIPANPRAYTKGLDSGILPYIAGQFRERVKSAGHTKRAEALAFAKSLFAKGAVMDPKPKEVATSTSLGPILKAEDPPATLPVEHQLRAVAAMKCMKLAYGHGMCTDAAGHIKDAHAMVKAMLPDDYPYEDDPDDPSDLADPKSLALPGGHACAAAGGTVTLTLIADTTEAQQKLADLQAELAAKNAELESISSTATQRAGEVADAEAKVASLNAEIQTLEAKIAQLAATPTGRQTASRGGSSQGAGYRERTATMHDAQRSLGLKLTGAATEHDPAMRPA